MQAEGVRLHWHWCLHEHHGPRGQFLCCTIQYSIYPGFESFSGHVRQSVGCQVHGSQHKLRAVAFLVPLPCYPPRLSFLSTPSLFSPTTLLVFSPPSIPHHTPSPAPNCRPDSHQRFSLATGDSVESPTAPNPDGTAPVPGSVPLKRRSKLASITNIFKPWKWRRKKASEKFQETSARKLHNTLLQSGALHPLASRLRSYHLHQQYLVPERHWEWMVAGDRTLILVGLYFQ